MNVMKRGESMRLDSDLLACKVWGCVSEDLNFKELWSIAENQVPLEQVINLAIRKTIKECERKMS